MAQLVSLSFLCCCTHVIFLTNCLILWFHSEFKLNLLGIFWQKESNIASVIRKTSAWCFTKTKKLIYLHKCSQVFCAWKIQQTRHKLRHRPANLIVNLKVGPANLPIEINLPRTPSVKSILQGKKQNEVNNRIIVWRNEVLKSCDKIFQGN